MLGQFWRSPEPTRELSPLLCRDITDPPPPSGRFTAPDRSLFVRPDMARLTAVSASQADIGGERNGGEKLRQRRSSFPFPTMAAGEIGLNGFSWSRRVRLYFWIVESSIVERETSRRRSGISDGFFRFRPRRRTRPVSLASFQYGEHYGGLR